MNTKKRHQGTHKALPNIGTTPSQKSVIRLTYSMKPPTSQKLFYNQLHLYFMTKFALFKNQDGNQIVTLNC